ncbi:methyltransferase domain-containing protein [Jiulongibacter sp. NS-SX5]|uniref:methyltransferase domain-containing protein n=1 Tax=Jiulongibacter sp. NS-SX5 TaxID=3463854 RepID=UPI004059F0D1
MPDFKQRSYQKELMDLGEFSTEDFEQNLYELKLTNTYLGGHQATLKILDLFFAKHPNKPLHIADVACGGGDAILAMAKYAQRKGRSIRITGIDLNETCIAYAQKQTSEYKQIDFIHSPYQDCKAEFDIITCSLFTHHLNEKELADYLKWANAHSGMGFIINDLHRHPLAYYSIKFISRVFPFSYLYRNDAPLSVLRSFTMKEWLTHGEKVGIKLKTKWNWAFRHSTWHLK